MNQSMNDMSKRELPHTHEWCESFAKRTGINVYAGNPPISLMIEDIMGRLKALSSLVETKLADLEKTQTKENENESKSKRSKSV